MYRILIPEDIAESGKRYLTDRGYELKVGVPTDIPSLKKEIARADGIIVRNASYPKEVFEGAERLKVIARHGIGVDNIDVAAANAQGIWVVNGPGSNSNAVAEHTVAAIAALFCRLHLTDRYTRKGDWHYRLQMERREMKGAVLGLIGFGNIGRLVAEKAAAGFGMEVLAYDMSAAARGGIAQDGTVQTGTVRGVWSGTVQGGTAPGGIAQSSITLGDVSLGGIAQGSIALGDVSPGGIAQSSIALGDVSRSDTPVRILDDLDAVLTRADVVSLHIPCTESTRGLFDYSRFMKMKKGSFFINCARGELYVEEDLVRVLEEGHLAGAGLGGYQGEPPGDSRLFALEQAICSQHNAGISRESKERMSLQAAIGVDQVLTGQTPSWPVGHPDGI